MWAKNDLKHELRLRVVLRFMEDFRITKLELNKKATYVQVHLSYK